MRTVRSLTPTFAVTTELASADYEVVAAQGFTTVINFLPDSESQTASDAAAAAARAASLDYTHLSAAKYDLFTDPLVTATAEALAQATGPVLAYCASGQRAAILWAAATARSQPVDQVLAVLAAAQFDLEFLRDDLEAQADRARWMEPSNGRADTLGDSKVPAPKPLARAAA